MKESEDSAPEPRPPADEETVVVTPTINLKYQKGSRSLRQRQYGRAEQTLPSHQHGTQSSKQLPSIDWKQHSLVLHRANVGAACWCGQGNGGCTVHRARGRSCRLSPPLLFHKGHHIHRWCLKPRRSVLALKISTFLECSHRTYTKTRHRFAFTCMLERQVCGAQMPLLFDSQLFLLVLLTSIKAVKSKTTLAPTELDLFRRCVHHGMQ